MRTRSQSKLPTIVENPRQVPKPEFDYKAQPDYEVESLTLPPIQKYSVDIDFDEASRLWRSNKRLTGEGHFSYLCRATTKSGKSCNKCAVGGTDYCGMHRSYGQK